MVHGAWVRASAAFRWKRYTGYLTGCKEGIELVNAIKPEGCSPLDGKMASLPPFRGKLRVIGTTDTMRRDWDERARKNAFHYIASWRKEWDLAAFLASAAGAAETVKIGVVKGSVVGPVYILSLIHI